MNTMRNVSVGRLNNYEIKYKFGIYTVTQYDYVNWSLVKYTTANNNRNSIKFTDQRQYN